MSEDKLPGINVLQFAQLTQIAATFWPPFLLGRSV